jgi:hypothetical protein
MANFDENTWYQLNVAGSDQSMAGTGLYDQGKGAVFFAITNTSDGQQQWQLFPFNSSCYVLRTAESGQFGYLATGASTDESTPGETVPEVSAPCTLPKYSSEATLTFWSHRCAT